MRIAAAALAILLTLSACGGAGSPAAATATTAPTASPKPTPAASVVIKDDAKLGKILVTPAGATLYIFKKDTDNTSNCYDACATTWPPFVITADPVAAVGMTGKLGIALRKDNAKQVTYNNQPLYFFANDKAAGETNGEGVGGNWFVVKNP